MAAKIADMVAKNGYQARMRGALRDENPYRELMERWEKGWDAADDKLIEQLMQNAPDVIGPLSQEGYLV
jgi:ribosome modulation factor